MLSILSQNLYHKPKSPIKREVHYIPHPSPSARSPRDFVDIIKDKEEEKKRRERELERQFYEKLRQSSVWSKNY